jgi:hypothetical protein
VLLLEGALSNGSDAEDLPVDIPAMRLVNVAQGFLAPAYRPDFTIKFPLKRSSHGAHPNGD